MSAANQHGTSSRIEGNVSISVADTASKPSARYFPTKRMRGATSHGQDVLHRATASRRPRVAAEFSNGMHAQDEVSLQTGVLLQKYLDSVFHDSKSSSPSSDVIACQSPASNPSQEESMQFDAFRLFEESPRGALVVSAQCEVHRGRDNSSGKGEAIHFRGQLVTPLQQLDVGRVAKVGEEPNESSGKIARDERAKRLKICYPASLNVLQPRQRASDAPHFEAGTQKFCEKELTSSSSEDESQHKRFASVVVHMKASDF